MTTSTNKTARKRGLTAAFTGTLLLLSGCGSGHHVAKSATPTFQSTTTTTSTTSPPTSPPATPSSTVTASSVATTSPSNCTASSVTIEFIGSQGAGGARGLAQFRITNKSPSPCVLYGYPGVAVDDQSGNRLPNTVVRGPGTLTQAPPPTTVTLAPMAIASFNVEYQRASTTGGSCQPVGGVDVILPNETASAHLNITSGGVPVLACAGNTFTVTPVQAGQHP